MKLEAFLTFSAENVTATGNAAARRETGRTEATVSLDMEASALGHPARSQYLCS